MDGQREIVEAVDESQPEKSRRLCCQQREAEVGTDDQTASEHKRAQEPDLRNQYTSR